MTDSLEHGMQNSTDQIFNTLRSVNKKFAKVLIKDDLRVSETEALEFFTANVCNKLQLALKAIPGIETVPSVTRPRIRHKSDPIRSGSVDIQTIDLKEAEEQHVLRDARNHQPPNPEGLRERITNADSRHARPSTLENPCEAKKTKTEHRSFVPEAEIDVNNLTAQTAAHVDDLTTQMTELTITRKRQQSPDITNFKKHRTPSEL